MPRRLRRPAAALAAAVLLPVLAACGGSSSKTASDDAGSSSATSGSSGSSTGSSTSASTGASTGASTSATAGGAASGSLPQVSFTGDVGTSLKSTWHAAIDKPATTTVTTLVKGTGDEVANGDTVSAYLYLGDGTTMKDLYSDYDNGSPESLTVSGQLSDAFVKLFAGATYGSRVVAVTDAADLFGSSASSASSRLGLGADDSLVVVADLVKKAEVSPTPSDAKVHDASPSTLPAVVETKGSPSGLDWTGIDKPAATTPVQRVILKQGTGAAVEATDTVTVDYLGETYQATKPFDESYSSQHLTSALSGLIQGWQIGLTGVKVGSRVLLQIPPAYGYGASGSGSSIPGNATLWFVIDVVSTQ